MLGSTFALSNGQRLACGCYPFTFLSVPVRLYKGGPVPVGHTWLDIVEVKWGWVFSPSRLSQNTASL